MSYYEHFVWAFPLYKILTTNVVDQGIVNPKDYFNASVQNFVVTLIITWSITTYYDPNQYKNHPVKPIIGNQNPCFGWDYPPASYVAVFMCSMNVYFTWRWAFLENARTKLQSEDPNHRGNFVQNFAKFTTWNMAFASNGWLLLWLVGPADTHYTADVDMLTWDKDALGMVAWTIHIGIFGMYTLACFLALLGNWLEVRFSPRRAVLQWYHTAFVIVYGWAVMYLVFTYLYAIMLYELGEPPATGSKYPTLIADLVWSFATMAIPYFTAPEIPLKITVEMATDTIEDK